MSRSLNSVYFLLLTNLDFFLKFFDFIISFIIISIEVVTKQPFQVFMLIKSFEYITIV